VWHIAFRNIWRNKSRTILAMLALIVGIITIIVLVSATLGVKSSVSNVMGQMKGIIVYEHDAADVPYSHLSSDYEEKLEDIRGVRVALPEIYGMVRTIDGKKAEGTGSFTAGMVMLVGLDPKKERMRQGDMYGIGVEEGRKFISSDKYAAIISKDIADNYKKNIGSKIELDDGKKYTVIGILEESSVLGSIIVVPLDRARELAHLKEDEVNSFTVQTKNPEDEKRIATLIKMKYPELEAITASQAVEETEDIMGIMDLFFYVMASISLIIAGIGIVNAMLMSVLERTKEFGVLKAVGWENDDLLKLIIEESILIGVVGGIIGIIISVAIVEILNNYMPFSLLITKELIGEAFLFSVIAGIVGGIYPAWRVTKIDPIQAIRGE